MGPKVRILSLGTGIAYLNEIDPNAFTGFDLLKRSSDFMIDIDAFSTDKILENVFND